MKPQATYGAAFGILVAASVLTACKPAPNPLLMEAKATVCELLVTNRAKAVKTIGYNDFEQGMNVQCLGNPNFFANEPFMKDGKTLCTRYFKALVPLLKQHKRFEKITTAHFKDESLTQLLPMLNTYETAYAMGAHDAKGLKAFAASIQKHHK